MKILIDEKWQYGDTLYNKGDTIELSKEKFDALVTDGVKLVLAKEEKPKEIKKYADDKL